MLGNWSSCHFSAWSHLCLETPHPYSNLWPTQGLTEAEPMGVTWLGGHQAPLWGWAEARHRQVMVRMQINGSMARVAGWPQPATKHHPTFGSVLCPRVWGGKWREEKLMDRDINSLIRKAKAVHGSKARGGIHSLFPISRQIFSPFLGGRASAHAVVAWEDRCHNYDCVPLPFSFFPWAFTAQNNVIWYDISLWPFCVSCRRCVPSQAFAHTLLTLEWGGERRPWHCEIPPQR